MQRQKSVLLTILVAFIWSLSGLFVKTISWNAMAIACGRSAVAGVLLWPIVRKSKIHLDRAVFGYAICYCLFTYSFIGSNKLTTAAMAIMMQYCAPIYVALFSFFWWKEKLSRADLLCLFGVIIGMVLFFLDQFGGGSALGNLIAVGNGIFFAGISLFLRQQKNNDPIVCVFMGNMLTAIVGLPFLVQVPFTFEIDWMLVLLNGIFIALSYALYAYASKGLSALEAVLIPILDPILTPIWVLLLIGEKPGVSAIIGSAIILASITMNVCSKRTSDPTHKEVATGV